jgi:hypothetical protein
MVKGMPVSVIDLFDISFDLLEKDSRGAMNRIAEFEKDFPHDLYFITALRYIAADFFSDDEARVKRAKKALIDSIDHYCTEELKKKKK